MQISLQMKLLRVLRKDKNNKNKGLILIIFLFIFIFFILLALAHAEIFKAEEITTFVSPDCSYDSLKEFLENANYCIYINVYTFTNPEIAEILKQEKEKGIEVLLMVEKSPAGGIKDEEKKILSFLSGKGVKVYFSDGKFRYNHAKYIIRDNSSILITTENFGYGGFSSSMTGNRGWGAIIKSEELSKFFLNLFFTDLKKAIPYTEGICLNLKISNEKTKNKVRHFKLRKFGPAMVEPVVAPDAVEDVLQLLNLANSSIMIEQFYIYKHWGSRKHDSVEKAPNLFLEKVIDKARHGVNVKILLDATWYNLDKSNPVSNYYTIKYVKELAEKEKLPIEIKLADKKKFRKLHAKGVIIDKSIVFISSINWNENSPRRNREVGVIIYGKPAEYFVSVFEYDWKSESESERDRYYIIGFIFVLLILITILLISKRNALK